MMQRLSVAPGQQFADWANRARGYARTLRNLEKRSAYDALADMCERYKELSARDTLALYERKVLSQNGEDGVIAEILSRIGVADRRFVEFGAGDGTENNCAFLADVLGWIGVFAEADERSATALAWKYRYCEEVETRHERVTPESVDALVTDALRGATELDLLSIDVDSIDFHLWKNVVSTRPRVVIVEYNSALPAKTRMTLPLRATPDPRRGYSGASLPALVALGEAKGYSFVYSELSGTNAFFVRDDLVDALGNLPSVARGFNHHLRGAREAPDPSAEAWDAV